MSIKRILTFAIILALFTACGSPNAENSGDDAANTPTQTTTDVNAPNDKGEAARNSIGVWHYTCPNGCADGAGNAIPCPKCGTTLVHNSVYHETPAAPAAATPTLTPPPSTNPFASPAIAPTGAAPIGNAPKAPEPAQNAKGVWHYTCSKGCEGGGGSAIACSKCGTTLAHNQAYHN